jgi:hypothetical protein
MLWRCKYDNNNFLQLRLYFPTDVFPPNTYPNIPWTYGFMISSLSNIGLNAGTRITRLLYIPRGEYKNIRQVLDAMQKTINDVITKPNEFLIRPFRSAFTITLELNTDPAVNAECIKFKLKKNHQMIQMKIYQYNLILQMYRIYSVVIQQSLWFI